MIRINNAACVKCGSCVRDCVVKALTVGEDGYPRVRPQDEKYCLNCQHCLAVCPVGAVECHGVSIADTLPLGALPSPSAMLNAIAQRRSIRQYKREDLDARTMQALVDSLAWTPTGCNDHRLFFTVVQSREKMDFFRTEVHKALKFLIKTGVLRLFYPGFQRYMNEILAGEDVIFRNAPHMVVAATPVKAPCAEADPWIALSYFDMMAQSLGVGTCWCGFAIHAFKWLPSMRRRLELPPKYKVGAVLLFGTPDVSYQRQTRPKQFDVNML